MVRRPAAQHRIDLAETELRHDQARELCRLSPLVAELDRGRQQTVGGFPAATLEVEKPRDQREAWGTLRVRRAIEGQVPGGFGDRRLRPVELERSPRREQERRPAPGGLPVALDQVVGQRLGGRVV